MQTSPPAPDAVDIVIVGAGVAGLYCAYRLLGQNPSRRIAIFDLLDRVGGRLDTDLVHIKGLDRFDADGKLVPGRTVTVKEEEGGMRFNATMTELLSLIDDIGMWDRIIPFGMGDDNNYFHIRGRSFTAGESKGRNHAIWGELYNLAPNERGKSPGEIVMAVYRDLVLANGDLPPDNPTPEFWQRFRLDFTFQGIPLNHWGLWSLYRAFGLSQECITMLADTSGFHGPFYSLVSAGAGYQLLEDFPLDPKFFALEDGFGSLPLALCDKVREMGGSVTLSAPVTGIVSTPSGFSVAVSRAGEAVSVACKQVILAIPPRPLERLLPASPALTANAALSDSLRRCIDSVLPMRLCKVNLYYNHAWWRDGSESRLPQIRNGGSFTTLPLGSVYVFDPLRGEDIAGPAGLTIYCDFRNTAFWEQLQALGPMFESPLQRDHNAAEPQVMFPASEAVVVEATVQLRDMFQMIAVPRPVLTSFRLWSGEHEFGAAYHQWGRHVDDRAIIETVAAPSPGLFICNEAFSDDQGWVNGTLRSANNVLARGFGLAPLATGEKTLPGRTERGPVEQGPVGPLEAAAR